MNSGSELLLPHGGYENLKSFQVSRLVYDLTVRFVELYIDRKSRTCDQMVQAARSGVQNIAEGSVAAATSKKTELKLTNVARASLEELKLDYEDFLRQRGLQTWDRQDPRRQELIDARFTMFDDLRCWINGQSGRCGQCTSSTMSTSSTREVAANTALILINVATYLLTRQLERLAADFEQEGGFTENLYQVRKQKRGY